MGDSDNGSGEYCQECWSSCDECACERNKVTKERDAARAEVERLRALLRFPLEYARTYVRPSADVERWEAEARLALGVSRG